MGKIADWTAAVLVAGSISLGGYVASTNGTPDTRPGPDVKIALTIVSADGKEMTGTCSGVYIGNGVVITAKHCTDTEDNKLKSTIVIFDNGGTPEGAPSFDATVLWAADKADIAAFKIAVNVDVKSAELACRDPKIGEAIEVVGDPLGVDFVHSWGRVGGVTRTSPDGEEYVVPVDVAIASGNSGGPVYDALGKILGIADAVIQGQAPLGPGVGHVDIMVSSQAACGEFGPK